jgi:lactate dehydrogenase-like 2-hydroxyacid dehydrogenase
MTDGASNGSTNGASNGASNGAHNGSHSGASNGATNGALHRRQRRIAIVGTGYVGLVTGTCLAEFGNSVVCLDNDPSKIATLRRGELPFFEPQLLEMMVGNHHAGRLSSGKLPPRSAASWTDRRSSS